MNTPTYSKLEDIKDKAVRLRLAGIIKKCTENFFLIKYERLREEIELYRSWSIEIREQNLKRTLDEILMWDGILTIIELQNRVDRGYDDYFVEIFNKLGCFDDIDFWIIKWGTEHSPVCYHYPFGNDVSFILVVPESPNYLTQELIGLLAHEASHVYKTIDQFFQSTKSHRRKIGESLADLLAYILTDSLFLHSTKHFIKNIIGIENAVKTRRAHLSWMARMFVLSHLTDLIWLNREVLSRNRNYLHSLLRESAAIINPLEKPLILISIREGKDKIDEFTKFKIDESILSNIKNLSARDLEMCGKIIQIIHEIEVSN